MSSGQERGWRFESSWAYRRSARCRRTLSRSSADESTALRTRGSRVQVAPGQPITARRKVARGGTQPVSKAGPTSRSRVRLLHLPPIATIRLAFVPRSVKPASLKQAGRLTRGSNPRGALRIRLGGQVQDCRCPTLIAIPARGRGSTAESLAPPRGADARETDASPGSVGCRFVRRPRQFGMRLGS